MSRPSPFVASCVWGAVCGAVLGGVRTRATAFHLLAKGRALEALGIPSLPGPSHWETLASWQPAGAGALFFGLSLGLGTGVFATLWVHATHRPTGSRGSLARWAVLAAPLWAGSTGDWGLATALAFTGLGAILWARGTVPMPAQSPGRRLACAALVAVGLVPWLLAPEGAFTRLRDRWLFRGPGLALNEFYYRWTLYPAETLKSLATKTQPVADVRALPLPWARAIADSVMPLHILAVPVGVERSDLEVQTRGETVYLVAGPNRILWPATPEDRAEAWESLSREADPSASLRSATAAALFFGCPLGLAWALGLTCAWGASRLAPRSAWAPFVLAALLAVSLAAAGSPSGEKEELAALRLTPTSESFRKALASASPVLRFYAARDAASLGAAPAEAALLSALRDPVINVRYAAAEGLGATGGPRAIQALRSLLGATEDWYVKERAYAALWRLGWRPPTP